MLMQIHGQAQLCVVSIYCSNYVIGAGGGSRRIEDCERQLLRICYESRSTPSRPKSRLSLMTHTYKKKTNMHVQL